MTEQIEPKVNTITFGIDGIPYSQITLDASDPDGGIATALSWHIAYTEVFDEIHAAQAVTQEIVTQQDAQAVAPQVESGHLVQEAVALGGEERCPDHPDRDPKPSQYGGTFCTNPNNPPVRMEYPDGTVKMLKFCNWKSQVKS
tara:strand:- start:2124 stop:2552 length:429 start_codon:yes stop_codon:yes gene_type:complete